LVKRKRSAKQKANDKKLGRMSKARARPKPRKTTTRKRRTTRRGDLTLMEWGQKRQKAYPRKRKSPKKDFF